MSNYQNFFLLMMAVIGLAGIITGSYIILFIAILIILSILFLRVWNNHIFDKLSVRRYFTEEKTEPGRPINYIVELENRKFLPVIAMRLVSTLSTELEFTGGHSYNKSRLNKRFRDVFSLRWYEKVRRKYVVVPRRRGLKGIFSAHLEYFDPFGFFQNHREDGERIRLFVHPRILPIKLAIKDNMLFGTHVHRGWIFEDRFNRIGVRPYQATDSFREINWKATARSLELKSNIYKPSLDREVYIFHGLNTEKKWWLEETSNTLEFSLVCAASISDQYFRKNYRVGFYSSLNTMDDASGKYTVLEAGPPDIQRDQLLKLMALLNSNGKTGLGDILEKEERNLKQGSSLIIINEYFDNKLKRVLNRLKSRFQISVISIISEGEQNNKQNNFIKSINIPGIKHYFVKEEAWDEVEQIKISN